MNQVSDNRPKVDRRSLRGSWALSKRHEKVFERAFKDITKNLIDSRFRSIIERGIANGSRPQSIINKLPFFDKKNPDTHVFWKKIAAKIETAYTQAVEETIAHEMNIRGWSFEVQKTRDPSSITKFLKRIALSLAVDLSNKEEKRILGVLKRLLKSNKIDKQRAELLIFQHVGITIKQQLMVERKMANAAASGASFAQQKRVGAALATRLREIRSVAIARTETASAINYALRESWRQAEKQGAIPKGTKKRWVQFIDERSSDICDALNGDVVGLNEDFNGGGFTGQGPPAHPNCRSTLELVFP